MHLLRALWTWLWRLLGPRPSGELEIRYEPARDGDADPGEVVWTWVPFEEDPSRGKDRPVLVVGRRGGRRVGLALTSQRGDRGDRVEVGRGAWDSGGQVSYAKLDRLIDLEERPIRREGAVLDRPRFDAVVRALRASALTRPGAPGRARSAPRR